MPKIPLNQLEALPEFTAQQFTDEQTETGDVKVIGRQLVRYFSESTLGWAGINFEADPDRAGQSRLLSNWLDLTGCNSFQLVMGRTCANAGADIVDGIGVYVQYNFDGSLGTNPTGQGGGDGSNFAEQVAGTTFAARGGPYPQTTIMSRGLGWGNWLSTIGPTCGRARIWLSRVIGATAGQSYAVALWAQVNPLGRSV